MWVFLLVALSLNLTVLSFSLNTAPYVFKITHDYLDDLLLLENTYSECSDDIEASSNLSTSLGSNVNNEKRYKVPSQVFDFLGFFLNSQRITLELPPEKKHDLWLDNYFSETEK